MNNYGALAVEIRTIAEHWKGANGGIYTIHAMSIELAKTLGPRLRPALETGRLPDCMMPDGGDPCHAFAELHEEVKGLRELDSAFADICAELGCAQDNEAALAAIARIRTERDAMQLVLGNQLAMMAALHQLMRGFMAPDKLAQERLSARIQATRALRDLPTE